MNNKKTSNKEFAAHFCDLEWTAGSTKLIQGVKGGRIPKGAYAGGNGSWIVGTPAQLILVVKTQRGEFVEKDIYYDVKDYTDVRITSKFRENLSQKLSDKEYVVSGNEIINIYEILNIIFR